MKLNLWVGGWCAMGALDAAIMGRPGFMAVAFVLAMLNTLIGAGLIKLPGVRA